MRFAMMGSGRGSNAEAVLCAWQQGALASAEPVLLLGDVPSSRFLTLGATFGVPARAFDPGSTRSKLSPGAVEEILDALTTAKVDLVVLAGFMRIVPSRLITSVGGRMINLHPSLLPAFKGLNGIGQAWEAGVPESGCTVHWVVPALDAGPILGQVRVARDVDDTIDSFAEKIHRAEHQLLPQVIAELSQQPLRPPGS